MAAPLQITPRADAPRKITTFIHAWMFVLGFSIVFIFGWGGAATVLGQLFGAYKSILGKIGGGIILLFGLANLQLIKIPWLYYDTRPQWKMTGSQNFISSGLMGMFFAAGWTPCIGTTLGAILTLGLSQETSIQAMILASGYALGLGLPFLVIGLGMDRAAHWLMRFRRYLRLVEILSGLLLILVGVLILTDRMTLIATWALRNRFFLDLSIGTTSAPNYFFAMLAGLLSFLSPCVLPLVPAYIGYLSGNALKGLPPG